MPTGYFSRMMRPHERRQTVSGIKREVLYGRDIAPPQVNTEDCKGCGQCVRVCVARVFELREKKSIVRYGENCFACGQCWAACSEKAVIQDEVVTEESQKPGPMPAVSPDMLQMLIRERRSTRLFTYKPVTKEQLLQIIEAGRYTPSATNRQNVRYKNWLKIPKEHSCQGAMVIGHPSLKYHRLVERRSPEIEWM